MHHAFIQLLGNLYCTCTQNNGIYIRKIWAIFYSSTVFKNHMGYLCISECNSVMLRFSHVVFVLQQKIVRISGLEPKWSMYNFSLIRLTYPFTCWTRFCLWQRWHISCWHNQPLYKGTWDKTQYVTSCYVSSEWLWFCQLSSVPCIYGICGCGVSGPRFEIGTVHHDFFASCLLSIIHFSLPTEKHVQSLSKKLVTKFHCNL